MCRHHSTLRTYPALTRSQETIQHRQSEGLDDSLCACIQTFTNTRTFHFCCSWLDIGHKYTSQLRGGSSPSRPTQTEWHDDDRAGHSRGQARRIWPKYEHVTTLTQVCPCGCQKHTPSRHQGSPSAWSQALQRKPEAVICGRSPLGPSRHFRPIQRHSLRWWGTDMNEPFGDVYGSVTWPYRSVFLRGNAMWQKVKWGPEETNQTLPVRVRWQELVKFRSFLFSQT